MNGHDMTFVGPTCLSDLDRCFLMCIDLTVANCDEAGSYELLNCNQAYGQNGTSAVSPVVAAVGLVWAFHS